MNLKDIKTKGQRIPDDIECVHSALCYTINQNILPSLDKINSFISHYSHSFSKEISVNIYSHTHLSIPDHLWRAEEVEAAKSERFICRELGYSRRQSVTTFQRCQSPAVEVQRTWSERERTNCQYRASTRSGSADQETFQYRNQA